MQPRFRMYVDEVGNPDLESSDNPNHRFLSPTGVIIELSEVADHVHPEMEAIKRRFFAAHPDEPIVFHRKEMVNFKPPFHRLADEAVREEFNGILLGLLRSWKYTVITVCIDKKAHKETYTTWRYDPYHYCLAVLLERYSIFLNRRKALGDVLAESRGGREDKRLKDSFRRLWEQGSGYIEARQFQRTLTSRELKVKSKANNISGLQLADLIAHPSRNEILHEQELLPKEIAPFASQVIEILAEKYDQLGPKIFGKKYL